LPTKFGSLGSVKDAAREKKLKRLVRRAGFSRRSGYQPDKLIEARVLATCTGAKPTLAASQAIKDPAIGCKASNSTMSRLYSCSDERRAKKLGWGIARSFRLGRGRIWALDGTFLRVFGKRFEKAARGYDSLHDETSLGYLFATVFDLASKRPVFWTLLPGNASEKLLLQPLMEAAMKACGRRPDIIVFDRGYLSKENVRWIGAHGLQWVSRAFVKMQVSDASKSLTPKTWFEYYEMGNCRDVYWAKCGPVRIVKDEDIDDGRVIDTRYLVGSTGLDAARMISLYGMRWDIEEYHKQLRAIGLNVLPTGKFEGIRLHVLMVALAYILLHTVAGFLKVFGKSVVTIVRRICIAALVSEPS